MAPFKVLAVDGGGMRGIIPALILAELEKRLQRPISDAFDMLSGTSTGGIIALGVVKPSADGKTAMPATNIVNLYETRGHTIFPHTMQQTFHVSTMLGAKYRADGLESVLQEFFGETRLKDALKPVLIPSYDIEKHMPIFFKSRRAQAEADSDFAMRDVARATSAAPTYLPPEKIETSDPLQYYALVDGGVLANSPAMCAYAEAIKMGHTDVLMVSMGTGEMHHPLKYADALRWGQVEWARPVLDIAIQGSAAIVDYQLQQLLETEGPNRTYFRFQMPLTPTTEALDNASDDNLKQLMDLTQQYLISTSTESMLEALVAQLNA